MSWAKNIQSRIQQNNQQPPAAALHKPQPLHQPQPAIVPTNLPTVVNNNINNNAIPTPASPLPGNKVNTNTVNNVVNAIPSPTTPVKDVKDINNNNNNATPTPTTPYKQLSSPFKDPPPSSAPTVSTNITSNTSSSSSSSTSTTSGTNIGNLLKQPTSINPPSSSSTTSKDAQPTTPKSPPTSTSPITSAIKPMVSQLPPTTNLSRVPSVVPQVKIVQKQLTSDMFKGVDFSTVQFVEDLTRKLVNDQVGVDGIHFEPLPFNTLFHNTQLQLSQLETTVDRKLDDLVEECNDYGREYRAKLQELLTTYQETFQHFAKLEIGVNTIGAGAIHFGDELDGVTQQKAKAQSALSLINYLLELNNEESTQRSDIFTNSERIHELANLVKKLSTVSEDLKEISILNKGKSETESLSNTLENDLINQFERAHERNDMEKMKQCATTLYNFNGGNRCRARYIQKLKMFFDIDSLRKDENLSKDLSKRSIKGSTISDQRFDRFYADILRDISNEQNIIQKVFVNQTSAMGMLITRVFEQRVRMFIENVLGLEENNNLLYLQTFYYAFTNTKKLLVDPLSQYGISGIDLVNLLNSTFWSYQDGYITREMNSLTDILNELLMEERDRVKSLEKMGQFDEDGLNPEFTQSFIQHVENALTRCLPLSPEQQVAENIKSIFFILLRGLCGDYIEPTLDRVMKLSPATSDKCKPSLNQLFRVILSVNQVVGQLQSMYQLFVIPPIQTNIHVQSQCSEQLYFNISAMEAKICNSIELSLNTMVALVEKTLLEQKKNDYLEEDYDTSVTKTCGNVVKLIHSLYDLPKSCLQGKNFTIYIEEFGQRLNIVFLNHFKKFKIGQGSGALKLMSDLNNYRELSKLFKSHKVEESFEILFELSKLHLVNAENFKSVIEGGPLSRMPKPDLILFIKQRSDFKSLWLDMI